MKFAICSTLGFIALIHPLTATQGQTAKAIPNVLTKVAEVPMPGSAVRFDYPEHINSANESWRGTKTGVQ